VKILKFIFTLLSFDCISLLCLGQAPGGNATNLQVWIKADKSVFTDAGSTLATNSDLVQQWNNLAPAASIHAIQTTAGNKPVFQTTGYNYNPYLSSDGTRFITMDELNISTTTTGAGVFVVYNYANIAQGSFATGPLSTVEAVSGGAVIGNINFESSLSNGGFFQGRRINVNGANEFLTTAVNTSVAKNTNPNLHLFWKSTSSTMSYQINGNAVGFASANVNFVYSDVNLFRGWRNATAATTGGQLPHILNGNISEVIMYSDNLTTASVNKIETYLALKYGLTLSHNYINTANVTLYDVASYGQDIIGIARNETDEEFLQKQSHTFDDVTRIFMSGLANSNQQNTTSGTDFGTDKAYVVMGHNGGMMCTNAATSAEKPVIVNKRLDREWKITNTAFTGNFNLSFDISGCSDFSSLPASQLVVLVDDDGNFSNASVYSLASGASISVNSNRIEVSNINNSLLPANSTNYITIGSLPVTPTPVQILSFEAIAGIRSVLLKWQTLSPNNNFLLEKSKNGSDWEYVSEVSFNKLSTNYTFTDLNPFDGINYYRIKQSDDDSFTKIVSISISFSDSIRFYPNPSASFIDVETGSKSIFKIEITDFTGKSYIVPIEKNSNTWHISTSALPSGVYLLTLYSKDVIKTFTFIKN
jgi:hypothetical protein